MSRGEPEASVYADTAATSKPGVRARKPESVLDRFLGLLSSVRFGIVMLSLLLVCCMIGMLVMQQNVDGFRQYYQNLTPAQRDVFRMLGFFDIYHSWYFSLLLAITGLNIILASIDRFPAAWQYVVKPKLTASPNFIRAQMFNKEQDVCEPPAALAEAVRSAWRKRRLRARITEEGDRITVFAQKNVWNRLGAYVVHVALLTIFTGGFLTNRLGEGGVMEIIPGRSSDSFLSQEIEIEGERVRTAKLPFTVECTDIRQQLIRPEGGLDTSNTVDWLSYIRIKDGDTEHDALVHLNEPYDYRGYRFFQSSYQALGHAREITLALEPVAGGPAREINIRRGGSADVDGIGRVSFVNFHPDFVVDGNRFGTASADYNNPVAELRVTGPDGKTNVALAFNPTMAAKVYANPGDKQAEVSLVAGHKVILRGFEKVGTSHTLAVQYDPGRTPVYIGFTLLPIALCGVFFFAHQRVWAVIEPNRSGGSKVLFGGNTNRNRPAFESRFNALVESATRNGGRQ